MARKMLFPDGASQRGFDERSPHHPSKLRRTDDFTVVTDKGSHLPTPMPKKENGTEGLGGSRGRSGEEGQKRLPCRSQPCEETPQPRAALRALSFRT